MESRRIVECLAGYGIPQLKIAHVVKVSLPTLHKAYRDELDRGAAQIEAALVANLMRLAQGDDGTALKAIMFALQARFGWSIFAPAREPVLRKKAAADLEALSAHEDNEWSDLLH